MAVCLEVRLLAASAWLVALGCARAPSDHPAPNPAGALHAEAEPPARGEALPAAPLVPVVVPQLRPGAARDVAFVSPRTLAILDAEHTLTLLDLDGTVRAVARGAGDAPLTVHGALLATSGGAFDLGTGASFALPASARPSPRGDRYALLDGEALVIGRVGGERVATVAHGAGAATLHWLDGDRLVLCGSESMQVRDEHGVLVALALHRAPACAPRPGGGAIAHLDGLGVLQTLHPETLEVIATRGTAGAPPDRLAWSADGGWLAAWRHDGGHLSLWDATSGEGGELSVDGGIESVVVAPGGRYVVVALPARTEIFDLEGDVRTLGLARVRAAFDARGERLALASATGLLELDLRGGLHGPLRLVTTALAARATRIAVGYSRRGERLLVHTGATTFGWGWAGVEALERYDRSRISPSVAHGDFVPRDEHGARVIDSARYVALEQSESGCGVATRRADGVMVVLDAAGEERATVAFDEGEIPPCRTPDHPCGLPIAVSKDCSRVAIQRGGLLRVFDGATGRVIARRTMASRADRAHFGVAGPLLRDATSDAFHVLRVHDLSSVASLPEPWLHVSASGPEGEWHAVDTLDGLAFLDSTGSVVRVPCEEGSTSLTPIGAALVRETEHEVELWSPATGARVARLEGPGPRHVVRASIDPPALAVVHCRGQRLVLGATDEPARDLGPCLEPAQLTAAGPGRVAVVDGRHARVVSLDGATLELEHFVTDDDAWLFVIDPSGPSVDGPAEHLGSLRLRAAGPVLDAALDAVALAPTFPARRGL